MGRGDKQTIVGSAGGVARRGRAGSGDDSRLRFEEREQEDVRRTGVRGYAMAWAALFLLTALTFGLSFIHLGALSLALALAIAVTKASLVVLIFMQLLYQRGASRAYFGLSVLLLLLLLGGVFADVGARFRPALPPGLAGQLAPQPARPGELNPGHPEQSRPLKAKVRR